MPDIVAWWSEPGRAGMTGQAWWGTAFPWTLAGFTAGAWSVDLPGRVERGAPFPGVLGVGPSLGAYDSVDFVPGSGGASAGFAGSLASAVAVPRISGERKTRGVVLFGSGTFGYEQNVLAIERGDSANGARAEVVEGAHGRAGALDRSGRHLWSFTSHWSRGAHRLEAGIGHRGAALLVQGGEEQAAGGNTGYASYRHGQGRLVWGASVDRGYDHHESVDGLGFTSRRDAQATHGVLGASWNGDRFAVDAQLSGTESEVHRQGDGAFATRAGWGWGVTSISMPLGPGRAEAALGAGRHEALGGFEPAPSLAYRLAGSDGRWEVRFATERVLWAAWSDLEYGEAPFLQSTWVGVIDGRVRGRAHMLRGFALAGRSRDRVLVPRQPIEDLWLREGFHADPEAYAFALAGADGAWEHGSWGTRGEGFALARGAGNTQPHIDPAWGGRAEVSYRMSLYQGDLGVRIHAGLEAVGAHLTEGLEPRALPARATSALGVTATLADAVFSIRVRNIENVISEETWVDSSTLSEALGAGREVRLTVTVKLSD